MATATATEHGIYLVGTYEGTRPGREFKRRSGEQGRKQELGVRVGDDVIAVQGDDEAAIARALGDAGDPAPGEPIQLRVFARLVKDFDRRYAFITYELPLASGESRDAGWS